MANLKRDVANLVVFKGNDLRLVCTVRDDDGQLVDISGSSEIRFTISAAAGEAAIVEKTLTGGGIAISTNTTFYIDITDDDTNSLTDTTYWPELEHAVCQRIGRASIVNSYYHECTITTAAGLKYTVMSGRWFSRTSTPESA